MPLRDEKGKRLSGAQQRARAATPLPPLSRAARQAFAQIGPPPDDADELLVWGRRVIAAATWLVATGQLDPQRARVLKDAIFALGSTHSRSKIEAKYRELEKKLAGRGTQGGAVRMVPGAAVKKPPTARGARPPGPRALPPNAVADDLGGDDAPDGAQE